MSQFLKIVGGRVFDPVNRIDGVVTDLYIANGRLVESLPNDLTPQQTRYIDATQCFVMPGGIDLHTHLAIPQASQHQPPYQDLLPVSLAAHRYTSLGYTTVIEAAVDPQCVKPSCDLLSQAHNLDIGFLLEFGSHPKIIAQN